ncbi:MAG: helix-turn-helix transcriptional regulator [Saprospiraceae bacterium]|uniref:Helix-turn-helix transcriptional regulator n=1 Tax=Candidatus Opimibacter skivensis TaxID=2982028 RepID=A0A9D7T0Y1_9BACT|nr:helix-turn-helix transcriptional regulator [Candidatus Opimibacter skivensis]
MKVEEIKIDLTDQAKLSETGLNLYHREITVSEHIQLALFEATHTSHITIVNRFDNPKPHIGFNFCVAGATSFALTGGYPTAFADSSKVNNFLMPTCKVTQELVLKPSISLLTLYVDLPAFLKLIGESLEALPFQFLDAMHMSNKCYFESYQWQAIIKNTLSQIFHSQMSPLAMRIFIESKSLELIAIILDIYAKGNQRQFTISRSDIDKIQFAKDLLLRDIANPPSLSKLAREAGTNEFTLKKGFKELFNVPVFKYLQQMRLAKAYELFQATNLQVSEVAIIVGYESVSSFNRAFLQFYGMKPGDVKRIPFKTI